MTKFRLANYAFLIAILFTIGAMASEDLEVFRSDLVSQSSIDKNAILLGLESSNYVTYSKDAEFDQNPYGLSLIYDKVSVGDSITFSMSAKSYWTPEQSLLSYNRLDEIAVNNSQRILNGTFYFGRKKYMWSVIDEDWNLGAWQPLYMGNYIRPESQGLTGIISEFKTSGARATFFISPFFIPNIGPSFLVHDGKFQSASPWFSIPAQQLMLGGNPISIYYDIERPATRDILFNAGGGGQIFLGNSMAGGWFMASYAYKPVNQLGVAIGQGGFDTDSPDPSQFGVKITPFVQHHQLATIESGYRRKAAHFHAGFIVDAPTKTEIPEGASGFVMNDNYIFSPSVSYLVTPSSRLRLSYLKRWEGREEFVGDRATALACRTLDRYLFTEAVKAEYIGKWTDFLHISLSGTYDAHWGGALIGSEVAYRPQKDFEVVLGIEALGDVTTPHSQDPNIFSAYKGNDRVYGGIHYVF